MNKEIFKKSKGMPFGVDMVQAILDGRKTKVRMVVKYKKEIDAEMVGFSCFTPEGHFSVRGVHENGDYGESFFKLRYKKGDIVYVKETFLKEDISSNLPDGLKKSPRWVSGRFMPKSAARIFLEITDVKVERLHDISINDAIAEGIEVLSIPGLPEHVVPFKDYLNDDNYFQRSDYSFQSLWEKTNGKKSWDANPWVWVYEFKKIDV